MTASDAIVVGGGLVGGAIAFGLARLGLRIVLFDEGDDAFRAARGNFGLVTVQSKGIENPAYHRWTRLSADSWAGLAAELGRLTGIDVGHQRRGAVTPCLSEAEWIETGTQLKCLRAATGEIGFDYEMLDHEGVAKIVPRIGAAVVGGAYTAYDGQCAPLALLRALHAATVRLGSRYLSHARVDSIEAAPHAFRVTGGGETVSAPRLVLAAGLGNRQLAPKVALSAPVRPDRGQIIVTERTEPLIPLPLRPLIRQNREGSVMLGLSSEDAGFDDRTTTATLSLIARRAIRILPCLAGVGVVRAWGALRVMVPDGYPVYEQSLEFPGAFVASCHSGVTLAAAHALHLPRHVVAGALPAEFAGFAGRRFGVAPAPGAASSGVSRA